MNQEEFNLVNKEEVYAKSYEELLKLEKDLMRNPEATDLDLAFVSSVVIDRELEMGIDNTIPWDEVIDELLKEAKFENSNKRSCTSRVITN